jgi:5-formyltetrahydrofolate cyclo-ligase
LTGSTSGSIAKSEIRRRVWKELGHVAFPDPIFDYDFSSFIPDFRGSDSCFRNVSDLEIYRKSNLTFLTPDNSVTRFREAAILQGKRYLMTTYGIKRGFLYFEKGSVPEEQASYASTLYGSEILGKRVSLRNLIGLGTIDLIVTGAAAVRSDGIRFGKGHGYFDVEWGIFTSLGLVNEKTMIITVVHDCQVVDATDFTPDGFDTVTDYIVTPTRVIHVGTRHPKPQGIDWGSLSDELFASIPPLQELAAMKGIRRPSAPIQSND